MSKIIKLLKKYFQFYDIILEFCSRLLLDKPYNKKRISHGDTMG